MVFSWGSDTPEGPLPGGGGAPQGPALTSGLHGGDAARRRPRSQTGGRLCSPPVPAPLTLLPAPAPGKAVRLRVLRPGQQGGAAEEVTGRHALLDGPRAHLPPSLWARGEPEAAGGPTSLSALV